MKGVEEKAKGGHFTSPRHLSSREDYIDRIFAQESEVHLKIKRALQLDQKEGINISAYEGRILQLLIDLIQAKKVLELGTLYGYSALWMAYALPEEGRLVSLENNKDHAKKARFFLDQTEVKGKVEIVSGGALDFLNSEVNRSFLCSCDMLFIDADKASYEKYLDWAEGNLKKGALIVADNTFLFGGVLSPKKQESFKEKYSEETVGTMNRFNERLSDFKKYRSIIIPTSEGLTVAKKLF